MLSSDGTGLYIDSLYINIFCIDISVLALAQLAGGTRHPRGYQTLHHGSGYGRATALVFCLILPQHCRGNLSSCGCDLEKCGGKKISHICGEKAFLLDAGPILHSQAGQFAFPRLQGISRGLRTVSAFWDSQHRFEVESWKEQLFPGWASPAAWESSLGWTSR